MTLQDIAELEKLAEQNDGHCPECHHVIKVYRYTINKSAAIFLRAMANAVDDSGVNDIDISTIGLPYSVRSQVAKIRQHGLLARVKNSAGAQIPSRWLITHKGWDFVNGQEIPKTAVVYNNQTLGHEGGVTTIYKILGEVFDSTAPVYNEEPISPAEARVFNNVRQPQRYMVVTAKFKGRDYSGRFKTSQHYELQIQKLEIGQPVRLQAVDGKSTTVIYRDIADFRRYWTVVQP